MCALLLSTALPQVAQYASPCSNEWLFIILLALAQKLMPKQISVKRCFIVSIIFKLTILQNYMQKIKCSKVIDTSWSIRAAREENRLLQRKMRKSDEMLSIEERQIKKIKARMDELIISFHSLHCITS
jgi:hypothetical protein